MRSGRAPHPGRACVGVDARPRDDRQSRMGKPKLAPFGDLASGPAYFSGSATSPRSFTSPMSTRPSSTRFRRRPLLGSPK